ncbi:DUF3499 domain-containing protein [Mobilicoccus massiliensis]|uniref:DUF3499 domain-containing protein n=1 Tax=Mobilicoccus massiliensis TaxID=1522310 RepID=UPI000A9E6199
MRRCSRTACGRSAVATLTYVYAEQTAVLGPLATFAEPHTYDLCSFHAERLTAPQGWELVRLATHFEEARDGDDLLAVAEAVREQRETASPPLPGLDSFDDQAGEGDGTDGFGRVAHLRVLREGGGRP